MSKADKILNSWEEYKKYSLEALKTWIKVKDNLTNKQKREAVLLILKGAFSINHLKRSIKKWEKKGDDFNRYKIAVAKSMIAWDNMDKEIEKMNVEEVKEIMEKMEPDMEKFEEKVRKILKDAGVDKPVDMQEILKILGGK